MIPLSDASRRPVRFPIATVLIIAVTQINTGGVAYMAHIGGFIFGLLAGRLFEIPERIGSQRLLE
jgi:membrane associated rhomboid family serine protease